MKFDLGWMQEYLESPSPADTMSEALTHCGFLVETRDPAGDTEIWDMEATTNRPDVMCHRGMAREAAVALGTKLKPMKISLEEREELAADLASVEIQDPDLCRRYVGRVIRGARMVESPAWLRQRLENCGIRPINAIVDVTNYVLLETGQPLHAFDLKRLEGRRIIVRRAREGEVLRSLDGEERKLLGEDLIIADASKPVALAGIMGGADSEISDDTVDLLLESAHFEALPIRRTARRLGMHTEASHRFERGSDPEMVLVAADRAAALIAELTGATVCRGAIDVYPRPWTPKSLDIDIDRLSAFAGIEVSEEKVRKTFAGLDFQPHIDGKQVEVSIPSWRVDVQRRADLYEEIIRHIGYAEIPSVLPTLRTPPGKRNSNWELVDRGREAAMSCGLAEVITFAFIDPEVDARLRDWPLAPGNVVALDNPLAQTQGVMRLSLLPGLLRAARESLSQGENSVALFEQGRVFGMSETGEIVERERLGVVLAGDGASWPGLEKVDFLQLKGLVESLSDICYFPELCWEPTDDPRLDAGLGAAKLKTPEGRVVGMVGALGSEESAAWNLRNRLWVAELDLEAALRELPLPVFRPLPRFPSVTADMTVEYGRDLAYADLLAKVEELAGELVEDVRLLSLYEGKNIPAGKLRATLRIVYRNAERTLTQEEINEAQEALRSEMATALGVSFA